MRYISFMLTPEQILDQTKTVTRRAGWLSAKPGDLLQPARKCMGLKKGEKIQTLGPPIRLISVRQEPLHAMLLDQQYGLQETVREGFPDMTPERFAAFFCQSHKGCQYHTVITRLEFEYTA